MNDEVPEDEVIRATNPSTGEPLATRPRTRLADAQRAAHRASRAAEKWRRRSIAERATLLERVAEIATNRADAFAELMAEEMGKPVREGHDEVIKCAWAATYYAKNAADFLAPEVIASDARRSYVCFEPLGVVLAIMPWNFPFWQVFRFAMPALAAGNGVILKHATNVQGCAEAIVSLLSDAGTPPDLFCNVALSNDDTLRLIDHDAIAAVTLTGSTRAGRAVAARAGAALKKTVLELGGSDPYVILPDADIEASARACVKSRLINGGQSCIAAKRFVVVASRRAAFEQVVLRLMGNVSVGDPLDSETEMGPLARVDLRDRLHAQVVRSVERGAKLLLGGQIPKKPGAWYPPTVLTDVGPGMPAYDEELFGPVACIIQAENTAEALSIANDTAYGLGAAIFTADTDAGERLTPQLQAGSCFINDFVRSDPRLPFGGVKHSGYGRELSSLGIREFVNAKTIYVGK